MRTLLILSIILFISFRQVLSQTLLPWTEDFENAGPVLTYTSNAYPVNGLSEVNFSKTLNGRLRLSAGTGFYHSGTHAATIDCDAYNSSAPSNMLIVTLDMTYYKYAKDITLSFYYMQHGEEQHANDKVYIRGSNVKPWIVAYDLYTNRAASGTWKEVSNIDIDSILAAHGQTPSITFQVAFGQEDDYPAISTTGTDGVTFDDITVDSKTICWTGASNVYLNDGSNWNTGSVPNSTNNVIILSSASIMPVFCNNVFHFQCNDLYIQSGASFTYNQTVSSHVNGTIDVFGDLTIDGSLNFGYLLPGYRFNLYGDWINNGTFTASTLGVPSINFFGSDKRVIGGSKTTEFPKLIIDITNTSFDAIELTAQTNILHVEDLYIENGCLEINPYAVLEFDGLTIRADAGLNLNDGNIKMTVHNTFRNFNTSYSTTHGMINNPLNRITFDLESPSSNYLQFGSGTYQGTQLYSVHFNSSSNWPYQLISDMYIRDTLYLENGVIQADTNYIIVSNNSPDAIQMHNENSYINGNLRRYVLPGNYDLPVGSDEYYELAQIDIASVSGGLTCLDARFTKTNTEIPPAGLEINGDPITEFLDQGYWTITPNTGSADYDIILTSRGHTNGGAYPGQHAVFKRSGGSDWESIGIHNNTTQSGTGTNPITARRSSLNGFSDFIIGRNANYTLPVELISFTADCGSNEISLYWETASEMQNDYFTVEKSTDGVNFKTLAEIKGCGTCNYQSFYTFTDVEENQQQAYYRLKQTDYDGKYSFSKIIHPTCSSMIEKKADVYIYNNILNVKTQGYSEGNYWVTVTDNTGKIIHQSKLFLYDNQSEELQLSGLSAGIYQISFNNENGIMFSEKIFVLQ